MALATVLHHRNPQCSVTNQVKHRSIRYRRRLRSRIILSFFLLGTTLTSLFTYLTNYSRMRVENQLIEDMMNRNIDAYARRFYIDPNAPPEMPVQQMRAYALRRNDFSKLKLEQPDWYESKDGIHTITGIGENGQPFTYKLAVRKTPNEWFFLAYDVTQSQLGEQQLKHVLYFSVLVFSGLSLLIGMRSASRVMRPVSDLVARLRAYRGGRSENVQPLADHYADDEVGELAKALDEYAAQLTEIVRRDQEFNADVSHELRTPLAVIRGATELIITQTDLDPKILLKLQRIQRAEQQCTDLIGALLLLSRNEIGHGHSDVARVAEQLIESHRAQIGNKPIFFELLGKKSLYIDAPESVVSVALGNLIANAVKYTQEGKVSVFIGDNFVKVRDTGPGLSKEDCDKLFQRGYRGTHAHRAQGGAGIGLSIVSRLCDLYDWHVDVVPLEKCGVVATLTMASSVRK